MLAFSGDPSLNRAEAFSFSIKFVVEKNKNKQKRPGLAHLKNHHFLTWFTTGPVRLFISCYLSFPWSIWQHNRRHKCSTFVLNSSGTVRNGLLGKLVSEAFYNHFGDWPCGPYALDSTTHLLDSGKFRHFGNFETVHLVFAKILSLFWQIYYAIGWIFIGVNCQILNKWSSHLVTLPGPAIG